MRWSTLHSPTLRDYPAEAEAPSHQRLVRAGFVRQLAAGHYSLLPLAMRVRAKIMAIVREELNRIGGQEFLLPAMHPAEIWRRSGRWEVMGSEMFRLRDRKDAELALGMTHEEIFTTVATELNSYKQLPQIWYQFQTKFRDEPRPKSGLLRVREFTMKDSYSFDLDEAGLDAAFDKHRDAYLRIFERLGIPALPVEASNGTMGGWGSTEFMVPAAVGEDLVLRCPGCGYAANVETATSRLPEVADVEAPAVTPFDTPEVRTIDDLAVKHGVAAEHQIKTLVYVLDEQVTLVLLRGDHELVEQKLVDAIGAVAVRAAEPGEITAHLGASAGSLGAVGVTDLPVLADAALRGRAGMTTGANRDGVHVRGVDVDRDLTVGGWHDLRRVRPGEDCGNCGTALEEVRAIEVGHIFKLGTKYSEVLDAKVLDAGGRAVPVVMGSYGIGIERAIAAIVEVHHDESGIKWPVTVAPFTVAVVMMSVKDDEVRSTAEGLYRELSDVDVILDDRDARPGAKLTDVELVGIPFRITVGARGLKTGTVEITVRATGETESVPVAEAANHVRALLEKLWWCHGRSSV